MKHLDAIGTTVGLNGLLTMPPPLPTIMSHSTDMALGGPSTQPPEVSIFPTVHNTFALVGSGRDILLCPYWTLLSSRGRSQGLERLFKGRRGEDKRTEAAVRGIVDSWTEEESQEVGTGEQRGHWDCRTMIFWDPGG